MTQAVSARFVDSCSSKRCTFYVNIILLFVNVMSSTQTEHLLCLSAFDSIVLHSLLYALGSRKKRTIQALAV